MKFPRKDDNSLDFKAFLALSPENKALAFTDLKTHGTIEERQSFQSFNAEMKRKKAEYEQSQAKLREMEKQLEALKLREDQLVDNLKDRVRTFVAETITVASSSTTNNTSPSAPANSQPSGSFKL